VLELRQIAEGILLPVRAQPRSRRSAVTGLHAGRLKVAVTEAPEKGRANEAVAAVLAEALNLRPAQVRLLRGAASPKKEFLISGVALEELRLRIAVSLGDAAK